MSFILEALKKSENERQRQIGPSLADVRAQPRPTPKPWWAIGIGALLLVNLAVLALVLTRESPVAAPVTYERDRVPPATPATSTPVAPAATPIQTAPPAAPLNTPGASTPLTGANAASPAVRSLADEALESAPVDPTIANPELAGAAAVPDGPSIVTPAGGYTTPPAPVAEALPTLDQVLARGVQLPNLHLDIHVHSLKPAERFVFVNMRKYVEGQSLAEGPHLERITPEGAILNHSGTRFLVPKP